MNLIGVKFMLDFGHFLMISMSEEVYHRLLEDYSNAVNSQRHRILTGTTIVNGERVDWTLWTHRIVGIHTFDPKHLEPQNSPAIVGGGSGLVMKHYR